MTKIIETQIMRIYHFVIFIAIISGILNAQNAIEISAMGGYQFGGNYAIENGNIKIDSNPSFGFMVGIPVPETPGLMAEVSYSFTSSSLSYREQSNLPLQDLFDMTIHYFQAGATYQEDLGRFTPFAIMEVGAVLFHPHDGNYKDAWLLAASLGMGCKTLIHQRWGIRIQGRLLAPIQVEEGALWCQSGSGCAIYVKSGTILLQGDVMAGIFMQL
jgi:hypothetical protein